MTLKVLVVEDDAEMRGLLRASLAAEGFAVTTAVSLSEATAILKHDPPDLVVLDLGLPDGDGAERRAVRGRARCRSWSPRRGTSPPARSLCSTPGPTTTW